MIISDRYQFAFVHIPKCGGTSIRRALRPFDDTNGRFDENIVEVPERGRMDFTHLPLHILAELEPETFFKVKRYKSYAVVRDPFERFRSAFAQFAQCKLGSELAQMDTADLVQQISKVISHLSTNRGDAEVGYIHFQRQKNYIFFENEQIINNVYLLEDINDMFYDLSLYIPVPLEPFKHLNQSKVFRSPLLREPVLFGRGIVLRFLPRGPSSYLRRISRELFLSPSSQRIPPAFESREVKGFVAEYYAEDIDFLHNLRKLSGETTAAKGDGN
jgi:hypothetical protein